MIDAPMVTYADPRTIPLRASRPYLDLLLISFLILFYELACIRFFGSMVVFLTFFTNIVLLGTFLGMSVGCLAASSDRDWSRAVMPLFLTAAAMAYMSLLAYNLGNLWRRLALPKRIENWSLTSLQQRLVKTGGRLVKHARTTGFCWRKDI